MVRVVGEEKYRCGTCSKEFAFNEVMRNWKCPDCDELLLNFRS